MRGWLLRQEPYDECAVIHGVYPTFEAAAKAAPGHIIKWTTTGAFHHAQWGVSAGSPHLTDWVIEAVKIHGVAAE